MIFQGLWENLVLSVKAKLFHSGLNKLRVATSLGGTVAIQQPQQLVLLRRRFLAP